MTCEACNTIAPVMAVGYEPKGDWVEVAALKTYIAGDKSTATKAIVEVYDIFGPSNQTLQGADLLAAALNAIVLVPDLLKGEYAQYTWFANPTPENTALKNAFMGKVMMAFGPYVELLASVVIDAKAKFDGISSWGGLGLCWGGKVTVLLSGPESVYNTSAQVHPGALAKADAEKISIPHILLASNGEDPEVVKEYKAILEGEGKPGVVETYPTMHHGWMGTRANLNNPENLREYERGYNQVAAYFSKYL
ncbi:uncharacterized protein TRUGW13939_00036 [Talaromyces rugulosus]|uniref:Dienelactone hydrolase domain-containing protein n=1 Tax=Talaromyces rugulosus TaxID=121627 RepID=A0A7H8QHN5_TALRU|nr:uncharacterized protein TRUGW13939_00036 [Talaromyces rugulosus]QKX52965.1 hypothetical protein TRUGW13939_00036 [Talaromyces rugulosus]